MGPGGHVGFLHSGHEASERVHHSAAASAHVQLRLGQLIQLRVHTYTHACSVNTSTCTNTIKHTHTTAELNVNADHAQMRRRRGKKIKEGKKQLEEV